MAAGPTPADRDDDYRAHFASVLEDFDQRPRLVVDRGMQVLWNCENSPKMLVSPLPVQLDKGRLVAENAARQQEIAEFLSRVGREPERKLVRGASRRHWTMLRAWKTGGGNFAACIVFSPSLPHRGIEDSGLADELGLTRAEIRVLQEFAGLSSPREIALELGVSLSTVRSHLKRIHAKASVTSSVQLLRLTHTFCSG